MKSESYMYIPQGKIAHSLIPSEQFLAASFYGKFFARNLNLHLLRRRPEEWKTLQSNNKSSSTESDQSTLPPAVQPQQTPPAASTLPKSSKKRRAPEDDIDAVFKSTLGNKTKKAAMGQVSAHDAQRSADRQMSEVLGAIREAPSGESGSKKRRKVKS